jgi:hypothetical protein
MRRTGKLRSGLPGAMVLAVKGRALLKALRLAPCLYFSAPANTIQPDTLWSWPLGIFQLELRFKLQM